MLALSSGTLATRINNSSTARLLGVLRGDIRPTRAPHRPLREDGLDTGNTIASRAATLSPIAQHLPPDSDALYGSQTPGPASLFVQKETALVIAGSKHSWMPGPLESSSHEPAHASVTCWCRDGWLCSRHVDKPWPHDGCDGPRERCLRTDCAIGRASLR
jgi:hypothetical protein